jgi:hypothetical protein
MLRHTKAGDIGASRAGRVRRSLCDRAVYGSSDAQPTRATAGAGAATGTATRTVAGAPEGAGGAVPSADQSAKVHEYVMKESRPSVKVTQKVAVGTVLPTSGLAAAPKNAGSSDA